MKNSFKWVQKEPISSSVVVEIVIRVLRISCQFQFATIKLVCGKALSCTIELFKKLEVYFHLKIWEIQSTDCNENSGNSENCTKNRNSLYLNHNSHHFFFGGGSICTRLHKTFGSSHVFFTSAVKKIFGNSQKSWVKFGTSISPSVEVCI